MENTNGMKLNIDLKSAQTIYSPEGNCVFAEGVILKKISKFVAGTPEDALIPIPVFYDIQTGNVLIEMLPKELREEFQNKNND
jgi:hypothetical protein